VVSQWCHSGVTVALPQVLVIADEAVGKQLVKVCGEERVGARVLCTQPLEVLQRAAQGWEEKEGDLRAGGEGERNLSRLSLASSKIDLVTREIPSTQVVPTLSRRSSHVHTHQK
jgi:hypothetical protein